MKTRTSTNGSSGLRKKPGAGGSTGTEGGESGVFMSKRSHFARQAPNAASGAFGKIAQPSSGCGSAANRSDTVTVRGVLWLRQGFAGFSGPERTQQREGSDASKRNRGAPDRFRRRNLPF